MLPFTFAMLSCRKLWLLKPCYPLLSYWLSLFHTKLTKREWIKRNIRSLELKNCFFSMKALLCKILMFSWLIKKLMFIWIPISPLRSPAYSNKNSTFGYPHWSKCFPLISVSTPINNAPLNVGLLQLLPYSTSS